MCPAVRQSKTTLLHVYVGYVPPVVISLILCVLVRLLYAQLRLIIYLFIVTKFGTLMAVRYPV